MSGTFRPDSYSAIIAVSFVPAGFASFTVGVSQNSCGDFRCDPACDPACESDAIGVGNMSRAAIISRPGRRFAEPGDLLLRVGESVATGVGKDEHPLAAVRSADLGCAEQTPFRIEPELGQRPENVSEISSELWHVLHKHKVGSKYANAPLEL